MTPLAEFADANAAKGWRIVNDDVMGGVSRSRFEVRDGVASFSGVVSSENGGGFASVRAALASVDLAGASVLAIRVRGDGKRYQLRIRTSERWDGPAYKHDFETKGASWQELRLPLAAFVGTFRGRLLPDAPPVEPSAIRQVGFLIADKQFGPFHLDVAWIRALDR